MLIHSFTIKHRSCQPIFNNYRAALRLSEDGGVIHMVDCDGIIYLAESYIGKETHYQYKEDNF